MNDVTSNGLLRKPFGDVQRDSATQDLNRSLGPLHLVFFGVGCIIGSGIFVLTGNAAANFAGPAVLISFVIAGLACGFAALCYAELASTMPVAGSAYTYAYATLGEVCAWTCGWLMVLEFGVASALVAVGFDIVSLGTALAFSIVALSVMWLRSTQPELPRPFRVPFDGTRIGRAWMGKAMHGNAIPAFLLGGYCAAGALLYLGYGRRHSKLRGART